MMVFQQQEIVANLIDRSVNETNERVFHIDLIRSECVAGYTSAKTQTGLVSYDRFFRFADVPCAQYISAAFS